MAEVIGRRAFADVAECQRRFDTWRLLLTAAPFAHLAISSGHKGIGFRQACRLLGAGMTYWSQPAPTA